MKQKDVIFIGIDIGTQGVRVLAINEHGELLASDQHQFSFLHQDLQQEQSPSHWWSCTISSLQKVANKLRKVITMKQVIAISVTSTSGTVIPVNKNYEPIGPALMYSDKRSYHEAEHCKEASRSLSLEDYTPFNTSYGLPKILWFIKKFPEKVGEINLWCHPTDYIIGKLTNNWGITDYTNALKTGYHLEKEKWPSYLFNTLMLPHSWFPEVVHSGKIVGYISDEVAELIGFSAKVKVTAGITDGCASQIASGALSPGDWNTTIGTTLVIKGVTIKKINDPLGRIYNHKHPKGFWMPGGASNTGADWVSRNYESKELGELTKQAEGLIPTSIQSYPLQQKGERFPFIAKQAVGFDSRNGGRAELFAARMEGVSYIERLSYEMIERFGTEIKSIFTAGGASKSDVWLTIRANVMQKPIYKMKHMEGAVGSAIIAASETYYEDIEQAGKQMLQLEKTVEPGRFKTEYEENYHNFVEMLKTRGYLT
ncbi:FGGY-family carbohydrate kinase [Bacillus sp. REN16]|uniref:FGGY-family carbohydrate kinase n=1 Tax=Bacillus sp. REN16 TaxID=2887296 RepID=UPI001E2AFAF2|nr:FGGY-family carbohydrate kinase [Bacillus sp. REN16]MCC3355931.1 FGGY-family carbohydrate kinase [Bacillus sp. REN16]